MDKGARLLSNTGLTRRIAPVLGRREPDALAAASKPADAPILGRVAP